MSLALPFILCLPSWATSYFHSLSVLACSGQLGKLLPRYLGLRQLPFFTTAMRAWVFLTLLLTYQYLYFEYILVLGLHTMAFAHGYSCIVSLSRNSVFLHALQPLQSLMALPFPQGYTPSSHNLMAVWLVLFFIRLALLCSHCPMWRDQSRAALLQSFRMCRSQMLSSLWFFYIVESNTGNFCMCDTVSWVEQPCS